jgi:hypothetical protein
MDSWREDTQAEILQQLKKLNQNTKTNGFILIFIAVIVLASAAKAGLLHPWANWFFGG